MALGNGLAALEAMGSSSDSSSAFNDDGNPSQDQTPPDASTLKRLEAWTKSVNICLEPDFDVSMLDAVGMKVKNEYDIDEESRSEWLEKNRKAMELATQVAKEKQYPWPKASNVIYPLITTASIQFAARAYPAIIDGRNVVKGVVVGKDDGIPLPTPGQPNQVAQGAPAAGPPAPAAPSLQGPQAQPGPWLIPPGAKRAQADRVGQHMSWQVLDEQEEWEPEMDVLLHVLPIVGCEFKKSFFDSDKKRNASLRVSAENLVVNYHAKSMERAPRITEEVMFYPLEIEELKRAGTWRDIDNLVDDDTNGDHDAPVHFLEQHRWLDLDDDGYKEPYIVTVHKSSSRVVRIIARYDIDGISWNASKGRIQKIKAVHYYTKYDFLPNPDGGIYGIGFGRLLGPLNESINTTLNMLMDAGHLANTQGGFIGKGLSMSAGSMRFQPGEYKQVNAPGGQIRDNIVQLQFTGPNDVLFKLLGLLIEAGKDVASVKDVLTGETPGGNTPATTILAIIEQGLKVFSAIYKRIHRSLKSEFDKLYRLNRIYLDQEASYQVGDEWRDISRADYEKASGVEPYSDPTMITDMQKLGRAQFLLQFLNNPLLDQKEILERVFAAASMDNIDKLFAPAPPPNPSILAKAMELHTKQMEAEANVRKADAQALLYRAQSIQALATADKLVGDTHLAWINAQIESIQSTLEAQAQGATGQMPSPGNPAPTPFSGALPAGPIPDPHPMAPDPDAAVGVNTKGRDYTVRLGNQT